MDISGFNYLSPQSSYNINNIILVTNTTFHGNQAASEGGNMLISYDSKGACNLILSVSIEHCYIVQGQALTGVGYTFDILLLQLVMNRTNVIQEHHNTLVILQMSIL